MKTETLLLYETKFTPKGNSYFVHSTHKGEELVKNKPIAEFLVDTYGGELKLLPNQIADPNLYLSQMPKSTKHGKFPDALWNDEIWEFKTNSTGKITTLKKEIEKAHKQSNCVLIRFDYEVSIKEIHRAIKGEILVTKSLQKVWLWRLGKIIKFDRVQLTKKPHKY